MRPLPDRVGVTPDAETPGFRLKLVGAFVFLDGGAGAAFFDVHALASIRCDGVAAYPVAVTAVLTVRPLKNTVQIRV